MSQVSNGLRVSLINEMVSAESVHTEVEAF